MRDSALKHMRGQILDHGFVLVGEELMRDSALKPAITTAATILFLVGEELMRDSALKLVGRGQLGQRQAVVGEELMRDSALKPASNGFKRNNARRRRRAHARQRFETLDLADGGVVAV